MEGDRWSRLGDGFSIDRLPSPEDGGMNGRAALKLVNEGEENRGKVLHPLSTNSIMIMKRDAIRGELDKENAFVWNQSDPPACQSLKKHENRKRIEEDVTEFEIKTVLPRSKSTIGGCTPKAKTNRATDVVTMAIEDQVKEELKGLEARFFGLDESVLQPVGTGASVLGACAFFMYKKRNSPDETCAEPDNGSDAGARKEAKKHRPRRKSTKDDSLLSEARSRGRAKKERNKERADYAHTLDFSSLHLRKPTPSASATTSASAVTASSERPPAPEQPQLETPLSTKSTRKGLRKGSLSRSLKIFQERTL
jgi:hypothetical protein